MNSIKVKAYAKINWALNITGEAPNGYHLLDMLMQSISLHDTLTINKDEAQGLCIIGSNELTCSDDNLIIKAKKALEEYTGSELACSFILEKNIQEENEYISRTGVSIDATPREYLIVWLRFWKEKADVMRLFQDRRIHSAMVRHAMRHMDPESASIQQVSMAEPIMVRNLFASYGTMALLEIWNRDNYQITDEAMADFMLELLTQPLFHATIH